MSCICGANVPKYWTTRNGVDLAKCGNCGTGFPISVSSDGEHWTEEQKSWVGQYVVPGAKIVDVGKLTTPSAPRRTVDAFTMFELSDCPEVTKLFDYANVMLKRDGVLLIEVPVRETRDIHRWYFSAWSLEWLLEETGFLIVSSESVGYKLRIVAVPALHVQDVRIVVPSGIGDIHWLLTKMEALKEMEAPCKLTVVVQAGEPNPSNEDRVHIERSREFLEMVPFIDTVEFQPGDVVQDEGNSNVLEPVYYWIANHHLEAGHRLEDWRPELATNWYYPVNVPDAARKQARMIRSSAEGKLVLFYLSGSVWNHVVTGGGADWKPKDWVKLGSEIRAAYGCRPVIIGADWDQGYAYELWRLANREDYIDMVGKTPLPLALALLESADVVIGMGTGITMTGVHLGAKTIMFWPEESASHGRLKFDSKFQTNWVSPGMLASGRYIPKSLGTFRVQDVIADAKRLIGPAAKDLAGVQQEV